MKTSTQMGFTLIELVMVIVIIGVISVVLGKILFQGFQTFTTSQNISEADWQGFVALERLKNDIHNIQSPSSFSTIGSNSLSFTDMDGNTVSYTLSGGALLRNSQQLSTGITAFTLGYLDANGATTATASLVRYITISLTVTQGTLATSFTTLVGTRGMP